MTIHYTIINTSNWPDDEIEVRTRAPGMPREREGVRVPRGERVELAMTGGETVHVEITAHAAHEGSYVGKPVVEVREPTDEEK